MSLGRALNERQRSLSINQVQYRFAKTKIPRIAERVPRGHRRM
jgi:hypothetical protein